MTDKPERMLYPTFSCFDDAVEFVEFRLRTDPRLAFGSSLRIVHGICRGSAAKSNGTLADDQCYAHGWVEEDVPPFGTVVWQAGMLDGEKTFFPQPKARFYEDRDVQEVTSYTLRQVHAENRQSLTYGPWKPEYIALCRNGGQG